MEHGTTLYCLEVPSSLWDCEGGEVGLDKLGVLLCWSMLVHLELCKDVCVASSSRGFYQSPYDVCSDKCVTLAWSSVFKRQIDTQLSFD